MSHNGDPNQTRPNIWITKSHTEWVKGDNTTTLTVQIFDNEARTIPRDLTGETVFVIISTDEVYNEDWTVEITDKITNAVDGLLSSTLPKNAVNQLGEYKIEIYVLDGATRLYSHHEDFNVI